MIKLILWAVLIIVAFPLFLGVGGGLLGLAAGILGILAAILVTLEPPPLQFSWAESLCFPMVCSTCFPIPWTDS